MPTKNPIYEVPVASTDFIKGATFRSPASLMYAYRKNGVAIHGGLRFLQCVAVQMLSEPASTAWHIERAYDTLVEVEDSAWLEEIRSRIRPHIIDEKQLRHFMIYLDSLGCIETIASGWEILAEEVE